MVKGLFQAMGGVGVCALLWALMGAGLEVDGVDEVAAAVATGSVSVRCVAPESVAFVPTVSYAVVPAPTPTVTHQCVTALWGGVNGQAEIPTHCQDTDSQTLLIHHPTPVMKLAGLQCKAVTATDLEVRLVSSDTTDHSVALTSPHTPARPSDFLKPHQTETLFGPGGHIAGTALRDGLDSDTRRNGEIAFGGTHARTGATRTTVQLPSISDVPATAPALYFVFNAR